MPTVFVLICLLFYLCDFVHSQPLCVVMVSRHGNRAPNPDVLALCPKEIPNLQEYTAMNISLAGLTGLGMRELYELGLYTNQEYIQRLQFLSFTYNSEELFIRAVGEERTIQSAVAWGHGLYGPGSAPLGYYATMPAPLPIYNVPNAEDNLLDIRKAGCKERLKQDVEKYDEHGLPTLYADNKDLIEQIQNICGVQFVKDLNLTNGAMGNAYKDITDAFSFDFIENMHLIPGLDTQNLTRFRQLAIRQLLNRILGSEEQITYVNGDFPSTIRLHMEQAMNFRNERKMYAYHVHRELVYAMERYYNLSFNIKYPGLPESAIPPASTLFFELHQNLQNGNITPSESAFIIKIFLWIPCYKNTEFAESSHNHGDDYECGARQLKSGMCETINCTWEEFHDIELARLNRTGSWSTICSRLKSNYDTDVIDYAMEEREKIYLSQAEILPPLWKIHAFYLLLFGILLGFLYRRRTVANEYQRE